MSSVVPTQESGRTCDCFEEKTLISPGAGEGREMAQMAGGRGRHVITHGEVVRGRAAPACFSGGARSLHDLQISPLHPEFVLHPLNCVLRRANFFNLGEIQLTNFSFTDTVCQIPWGGLIHKGSEWGSFFRISAPFCILFVSRAFMNLCTYVDTQKYTPQKVYVNS